MTEVLTREEMVRRIVEVGRRDHRVAGLVEYGSKGGSHSIHGLILM